MEYSFFVIKKYSNQYKAALLQVWEASDWKYFASLIMISWQVLSV